MAGKRKPPNLRIDGAYYIAKIYKPEGTRTSISFGHVDDRPKAEVYAAFAKWTELYEKHPQKVLSFKNPYEAITQIFNPSSIMTIKEFFEMYLHRIKQELNPTRYGKENPDITKIRRAFRFMEPYHEWPVEDFGADELKSVQKALMKHKYSAGKTKKRYTRRGINDTINCIRTIWDWGLGRKIAAIEQVQSLKEIKPLRMGQPNVHDNHKRRRVTEEEFWKVIRVVNPIIGDMLQLIWYTAMRPYEVCDMRPYDILTDDTECWLYIPGRDRTPVGQHKTARFERAKVIPLTSDCQSILNSRIENFNSKDYIFSPTEAMREFQAQKFVKRKTPLNCGNRPGINKKDHPMIKPGLKYDHNSLCRACKRGCERADVETFVPYDLRRTMATGTRSILGKEATKVLLGHTKTDTTDIYLLEEVQEAMKIAKLLASKS